MSNQTKLIRIIENFKEMPLKKALVEEHVGTKSFYSLLQEFPDLKLEYDKVIKIKRGNITREKKSLGDLLSCIEEDYKKGLSMEAVSKKYKTSSIVIKRNFKEKGIIIRSQEEVNRIQGLKKCPLKTDQAWLNLHEEYRRTRRLYESCKKFHTTAKQALLNFERLGLQLYGREINNKYETNQGVKYAIDEDYWKELHEFYECHGIREVEEYCGLNRGRVFNMFKRYNLYIRNSKEEAEFRKMHKSCKNFEEVFSSLGEYELLENFKGYTKQGKWLKYNIRHTKCGNVFTRTLHDLKSLRCTHCYPKSKAENYIADFLEGKVKFERGNRSEIYPQELDIFIPSLNIAIEYNGRYWHNELVVPKNYHKNKTEECLKKGIKLYHFWEGQNDEIIKSRITSILGTSKTLFARKTTLKEVKVAERRSFFNNNHLSGDVSACFALGLYIGDELVSCISFRKHKEGIELARFASKLNCSVIGGFSKLLKEAEKKIAKEYSAEKVITYCNRDWTADYKDSVYFKNGFIFIKDSGPILTYYNSVEGKTESREKYQKHKLNKLFPEYNGENVNNFLVEKGIFRMYNSGNWKFEKRIRRNEN